MPEAGFHHRDTEFTEKILELLVYDFDFLLSYLPADSLDVRSATSPDDLNLAHPARQILMIASGWSPHTVMRLQLLARNLPAIVGRDVPVVLLDHDQFPPEFWEENKIDFLPEGWGEVLWIKDRKVFRLLKHLSAREDDLIWDYSRDLQISD